MKTCGILSGNYLTPDGGKLLKEHGFLFAGQRASGIIRPRLGFGINSVFS
jgi:hypothetical protein